MENDQAEARALVERGLSDAEDAIRSHPPATVALYESVLREFAAGESPENDASLALKFGVPQSDMLLSRRYLRAMAFMSAWYHLHGDKSRRDMAAQSAATLATGLGFSAETSFQTLLAFEQVWRSRLGAGGVAKGGCLGAILLIVISGAWIGFAVAAASM